MYAPLGKPDSKRLDFLIVDDEVVFSDLLTHYLTGFDNRFTFVTNGKSVERALLRRDYDCLFLDIFLPDIVGYDICRHIRDREARFKSKPLYIVGFSGLAEEPTRARCLEVGMDDFLHKPFDLKTVREVVDRFLRSQEGRWCSTASSSPG